MPRGPGPSIARRSASRRRAAVAERLLRGIADALGDPRNPRDAWRSRPRCPAGRTADPIRRELNARRAATEAAVRERFERAKAEGDLPADADPADLARYLATVTQGMAVQAAGGASRDDLRRVAELALRAWPESRRKAGR